MPLAPLPPDPEITAEELMACVARTTGYRPNVARRIARLLWKGGRRKANPDMFAVRFSPDDGYEDYRNSPLWGSIWKQVLSATPMCVGCDWFPYADAVTDLSMLVDRTPRGRSRKGGYMPLSKERKVADKGERLCEPD